MNKIIEFLSAFEPFVQFKHNKLGKITSSTDIDTIDCGYIWEKDYDDNLHCKVDDRFDIIKICLNNEWLDTAQVLKQYFNTPVSKFKDTQQLLKAYEALEKEFTKRSQRVADTEAKLKILQNGIIDDETLHMLVRAHSLYKDLEAKLAESEKEIKEWIAVRDDKNNVINKQTEKINQLKQQLATQENTITNLVEDNRASQEWYKKQLAEKEKENNYLVTKYNHSQGLLCNITRNNQDKISFCIEQLEKVLVLIHNAVNIDSPEYDLVGLYDAVSNQIKQLKEMK